MTETRSATTSMKLSTRAGGTVFATTGEGLRNARYSDFPRGDGTFSKTSFTPLLERSAKFKSQQDRLQSE